MSHVAETEKRPYALSGAKRDNDDFLRHLNSHNHSNIFSEDPYMHMQIALLFFTVGMKREQYVLERRVFNKKKLFDFSQKNAKETRLLFSFFSKPWWAKSP